MSGARPTLEALAVLAEKRLARAVVKATAARTELIDAEKAHAAAASRLTDWIAANPDPQPRLIEAITPEGEDQ